MEAALFAVAITTRQVLVQTANSNEKRKNQWTWPLERLKEEHLGMVIIYPLFFQSIIHLSGGWTLG